MTSLARVHGSLFSAGTRPKPFSCRLGLRERARRGPGRAGVRTTPTPGPGPLAQGAAGVPQGRECPGGGRRCSEWDAAGGAPSAYAELRRGADILAPNGEDGGSGPDAPMDRRRGSRSRRNPRREPAACPRGRGTPAAVRALPVSPSVRTAAAVADRCGSASSSC